MAPRKIPFYQKPPCTACRKAKALLQELKLDFKSRDLDKERLSESELHQLIGNRNELYRTRNMAEHPPTRPETLKPMARDPNLIRRPLLISGSQIIIGFDEAA